MKSILNGDIVAAKLFIEAGIPLNDEYEVEVEGQKVKMTPLILALSQTHGNVEIANLLLDNGADVNKYYYTERDHGPKRLVVTPLAEAFDPRPNWNTSNKQEKKNLILKIIDKGADVNTGFEDNDKPLNWAVHEGDPEIVKTMLKKGAKVTKTVLEDAERVKAKPNGNEIYEIIKSASSNEQ
jgi:ankyrin repeat protein